MPSIGTNSKPAYVYDAGTDTWIPIGPGEHTHDYIGKDVITTTGDIIYASAANTPARLGIGSSGQVLSVSGGVPVWAAPSAPTSQSASVYSTTGTSCNSGTYTTLLFNAEYFDTDGFHSTSTNTGRMTIPAGLGGKYLLICQVYFNPAANVGPTMKFQVNGNDNRRVVTYVAGGASLPGTLLNTAVLSLSAGDYVESLFYHDVGSAKNVVTDEYGHFSITRLGA